MIKLTKYIHVFPFHYLVMVIFLLTYLENTFFQIKNMSNTMCNALSIHVVTCIHVQALVCNGICGNICLRKILLILYENSLPDS